MKRSPKISRVDLDKIAKKHGWNFVDEQPEIGLVSYNKIFDGTVARINIYVTRMTVGTALTHPQQGKTQLFRKNIDRALLEKIFINPRQHTGRGYKRRGAL